MPSFCRIAGRSGLSSSQLQQIDYQRNVIPPAMRSPTPMEMFLYRSQTAGAHKIPGKHTCVNYTFYSCTCNVCTLVKIIVINFITCWLFKQARTLYSDWLSGLATFFCLHHSESTFWQGIKQNYFVPILLISTPPLPTSRPLKFVLTTRVFTDALLFAISVLLVKDWFSLLGKFLEIQESRFSWKY